MKFIIKTRKEKQNLLFALETKSSANFVALKREMISDKLNTEKISILIFVAVAVSKVLKSERIYLLGNALLKIGIPMVYNGSNNVSARPDRIAWIKIAEFSRTYADSGVI